LLVTNSNASFGKTLEVRVCPYR